MKHEQIDQLGLVDRYLMGNLSSEEVAVFEEHFVDCSQCIARLRTTKNFLQDLRLVAAQQGVLIEPRPARSAFRHSLKSLFLRPTAWAAVCLLIAAVTGSVFVIHNTRRLRDDIEQAKSLSEQWQRRYEEERQSAMAADQMHREAEAQRGEQLRALEARLKQQEAQSARTTAEPARRLPSQGNLPLFILTSVRSGEPNTTESVNRIDIPRAAAVFALTISLEDETRYETHRIKIFDDRQQLVWKSGELTPGWQGALSIWLKSSLFRPGDYTLVVEGENKAGGKEPIGNYHLLISKTP